MENRVNYTLLYDDRPEELAAYARSRGWLLSAESVCGLGRAGEGNMNLTLRVQTEERSFILKQARPWVEKYPDIPAPKERVLVEAAFYQAVADCPLVAERMPGFLGWDEENFVAAFADLGETADCTDLYNDGEAAFADLLGLCQWLAALHQATFDEPTRARLENRAMRQLNHEHLYCFPLRPDNGLDLDAITLGLAQAARPLQDDAAYCSAIDELGALYLENGSCLLHGDFYPGSWVRAGGDVWIIDPEFCFFGPPEFDVGILVGHLLLAGRPLELAQSAFDYYGTDSSFSHSLALQFAGMEIMRRLIGVAQLPLAADLPRKEALLTTSRELVLGR